MQSSLTSKKEFRYSSLFAPIAKEGAKGRRALQPWAAQLQGGLVVAKDISASLAAAC